MDPSLSLFLYIYMCVRVCMCVWFQILFQASDIFSCCIPYIYIYIYIHKVFLILVIEKMYLEVESMALSDYRLSLSLSLSLSLPIYNLLSLFFSSYNVWKHLRYPALISRQPGVMTQFQ